MRNQINALLSKNTFLILVVFIIATTSIGFSQIQPPTLVSPGSSSSPGPTITTLTPTFQWQAVSGAVGYGLYIRDMSTNTIIFDSEVNYGLITGTSFTIPSGYLQWGRPYRWNMRSKSSSGWGTQFSTLLYFQTPPQNIQPPTLVSPGSSSSPGPTITTLTPTFQWQAVSGAVGYGLYIRDMSTNTIIFDSEVNYGLITGTSFTIPSGYLQWGRPYRWNMRSKSSSGWGTQFSTPLYFQTPPQNIQPPTLVSPGSSSSPGPTITTLTPTFQWQAVSGAVGYGLYIRDMSTNTIIFDSEVNYGLITGTSFTIPSGYLQWGRPYRWNMRSKSSSGWGTQFSTPLYFQTPPQDIQPPTLVSPGSSSSPGPTITTLTPTFQWQAVSGAVGYGLYIRDMSTNTIIFDSEVNYGLITGTSFTIPSGYLQWGRPYRWNMRSKSSSGWGTQFSTPLYFQTDVQLIPAPIAYPATNITSSSFTANWSRVDGAIGYRLDVSTTSAFDNFVTGYNNLDVGNVLSKNITDLMPNTTYFYRVRAYNLSGTSINSNIISVTTTAISSTFIWPVTPNVVGQQYAAYGLVVPGKYHVGMDIGDGNYRYKTIVRAAYSGIIHKIFGLTGLPTSISLRRWNPSNDNYSWDAQPTIDGFGNSYGTDNHGLGICVIIYHPELKLYTLYGHLDAVLQGLTPGQSIQAGSPIGIMGNSYKFQQKGYLRFTPIGDSLPIPQGSPPPGFTWDQLIVRHSNGFRPHVHFEVKDRGVLSAGRFDSPTSQNEQHWGYTPGSVSENMPGHPNWYGYHDPNIFLNNVVQTFTNPVPVEILLTPLNVRDYPSTDNNLSLIITSVSSRTDGKKPAFIAMRSIDNKWYQIYLPNSETEGWSASGWIAGTIGGTQYSRENPSLNTITIFANSARVYSNPSNSSSTLVFVYGENQQDRQKFVTFESLSGWRRIFLPNKSPQPDGWVQETVLSAALEHIPTEFVLEQNYPNPFNPTTTIKFALPERSKVNLSVYNLLGEKVAELINDELSAGYHETQWNASGFSSGIYFYRLIAGSFTDTKKLILLK